MLKIYSSDPYWINHKISDKVSYFSSITIPQGIPFYFLTLTTTWTGLGNTTIAIILLGVLEESEEDQEGRLK